jgi:hypothetical protein
MSTNNGQCCLCANPGMNSVCVDHLNRANAYEELQEKYVDLADSVDSLRDRLRSAMRGLRRSEAACRKRAELTDEHFEATRQTTTADILRIFLETYFVPELVEEKEREKREAEFRRQTDAAKLREDEANPSEVPT